MKTLSTNIRMVIALVVIVGLNLLWSGKNWSLDLTQDKRFTLSEVTEQSVENLNQKLEINIYLEPELNSGFRRLYQSLELMLNQIQRIDQKKIALNFVKVDKLKGAERKTFEKMVKDFNMLPINVVDEDNSGKVTQKSIYPWLMMRYQKKELPVNLLSNLGGRSGEQNLNISIENMEFQLLNAIRLLTTTENKRVAFLEGHGEWSEDYVYDITTELSQYFSIDRGRIGTDVNMLLPYEALIIAAPIEPFTETEKFIIDQYVMQGGKVLWLVDGVRISSDSLQNASQTMGMYNDVNLNDILFSYGVRINPVLVKDLQCARIPINVAPQGAKADFKPMPWFYAPLFTASNLHPISRNLSAVKGEFSSTIDLVSGNKSIKKTVVLATGKQTALENTPAIVNLEQVVQQPDYKQFSTKHKAVAVLLEGTFPSSFLNRMPPKSVTIRPEDILSHSSPTSMMVIADGSIIKNEVQYIGTGKRILPLGFDKMTGSVVYGNKDFLLNAINYLTDETGIVSLRNRSIPLRLLNKEEANQKRYKWQILNILTPLLFLLIFALANQMYRKRKYQ